MNNSLSVYINEYQSFIIYRAHIIPIYLYRFSSLSKPTHSNFLSIYTHISTICARIFLILERAKIWTDRSFSCSCLFISAICYECALLRVEKFRFKSVLKRRPLISFLLSHSLDFLTPNTEFSAFVNYTVLIDAFFFCYIHYFRRNLF